jgi:hypothetical protein
MLPEAAIANYTLAEQRMCPVLSLYAEITPDFQVTGTETKVERVRIAANLRHDALEPVFNVGTLERGEIAHAQGSELKLLWRFATHLGHKRRGGEPEQEQRAEYSFHVENDRVTISPRVRGSAIDTLVSELMIFVNSTWGRALADAKLAAIYRVQSTGKVRMSTAPAAHEGLGRGTLHLGEFAVAALCRSRQPAPVGRTHNVAKRRRIVPAMKRCCPRCATSRLRTMLMPNFSARWNATGRCAGCCRKIGSASSPV